MTRLSEAWLSGARGASLSLNDPTLITLVKDHVDFCVLDATVATFTPNYLQTCIALSGDMPLLLRVDAAQRSQLSHALDAGIDGIIFCGIHSVVEAERMIAACLYPPEGVRAYRNTHAQPNVSLEILNDQLTLLLEISTPQAVSQISEIVDITGVDGVLLAPIRLSVAMEKPFQIEHPSVQQALRTVQQAAESLGMPWGLEGEWLESPQPWFHILASDTELVHAGLRQLFPVKQELSQLTAAEDEDLSGLRASR